MSLIHIFWPSLVVHSLYVSAPHQHTLYNYLSSTFARSLITPFLTWCNRDVCNKLFSNNPFQLLQIFISEADYSQFYKFSFSLPVLSCWTQRSNPQTQGSRSLISRSTSPRAVALTTADEHCLSITTKRQIRNNRIFYFLVGLYKSCLLYTSRCV